MVLRTLLRSLYVLILAAAALPAVNWRPVERSHLQIQQPKIDPEADAETLFWEVWVEDKMQGSMPQQIVTEYLRMKIFTDRGVEEYSTVDIASADRDKRITNVRARTIKPDGTIVELERNDVFERDVVKAGDVKVRMKSFSLPNVEAGDIIEYQWMVFEDNSWTQYERLYVQRETPAWEVRYHVLPSEYAARIGYRMRTQNFNVQHGGFEQEPLGHFGFAVHDMPALKDEPYMPPQDQVRGWILLFYSPKIDLDHEKFWKDTGKDLAREFGGYLDTGGAVKKKAAELTASLSTSEEKIEAVRQFVLNDIKNIHHERYGVTAAERQQLKEKRKLSDALADGYATGNEMNYLFASLLQASGIDAFPALAPSRSDVFFNPGYLTPYFFDTVCTAVRLGEEWRFYDLSEPYLEPLMLRWDHEAVLALVLDPKKPEFVQTPLSEGERNVTKRRGDFELLPDGTLQGDVVIQFAGHANRASKSRYDGMSEQERIDAVTELVRNRYSGAEVSEVKMGTVEDIDGKMAYRYKVRIPGYAIPTGKRLFLEPSFFQRNESPRFPSSGERKHDIYFSYPWREQDSVTIKLPAGYTLEEAEAPQSTRLGEVGYYEVRLGANDEGRTLVYTRELAFGENGGFYFPSTSYMQLKNAFDFMHAQDGHTLTLRAGE